MLSSSFDPSPRFDLVLRARIPGPAGIYHVAATKRGLLQIALPGCETREFESLVRQRLRRPARGKSGADPEALLLLVEDLLASWSRRAVERCYEDPLPLDMRGTEFQCRVWSELSRLRPGRVVSYGELAQAIGSPGAARAIGAAMRENPLPIFVPCHRVLARDGLGGFQAGAAVKLELLRREGLALSGLRTALPAELLKGL